MDITINGLTVERGRRKVLHIPALVIHHGRTTALLGPNGSGKTTLLRTIAALHRPVTGEVLLGDLPVRGDRRTREAIAFAFQDPVFLTGTVAENLDTALRLRGVAAQRRRERITEVAGEFGITHLLGRSTRQLSGGEAQRANLARALCLRAPLTLLDEPLAGLDGPARTRLLDELPGLVRAFAETTILVTHERLEAFRLADDLAVIMEGSIRAAGPKGEVFRAPPDAEVAAFLGYTLLEQRSATVAIPPGALAPGRSRYTFEMTVEAVVDMGTHLEATGHVGETRVSVPAPEGIAPGERIAVGSPTGIEYSRA